MRQKFIKSVLRDFPIKALTTNSAPASVHQKVAENGGGRLNGQGACRLRRVYAGRRSKIEFPVTTARQKWKKLENLHRPAEGGMNE